MFAFIIGLIARIASNAAYYAGDLISVPMMRFDWAFLYPTYNWLMRKSHAISDEFDLEVWG